MDPPGHGSSGPGAKRYAELLAGSPELQRRAELIEVVGPCGCIQDRPTSSIRWQALLALVSIGLSLLIRSGCHELRRVRTTGYAQAVTADYDAVVADAGPAGLSTATRTRALGCRVLVVERELEVGNPVHTSGATAPVTVERYGVPRDLHHRFTPCGS